MTRRRRTVNSGCGDVEEGFRRIGRVVSKLTPKSKTRRRQREAPRFRRRM